MSISLKNCWLLPLSILVVLTLTAYGQDNSYNQFTVLNWKSDRPAFAKRWTDRYAGNIAVLPGDTRLVRPEELKMLAQLGNHELMILKPDVLSFPERSRELVLKKTGDITDGLIINPVQGNSVWQQWMNGTMAEIRQRRPRLPIEGAPGPLTSRIERESELAINLARLINQRFGVAPRILPLYSDAGNEPLRQTISLMIAAVGGIEVIPNGSAALAGGAPDLLLFVALPGSTAAGRSRLVDGIERTLGRDVRIALADLTSDRESKEEMATLIRSRKWLDRLTGLAASEPLTPLAASQASEGASQGGGMGHGETVARALAQSVIFMASLNSLRDSESRILKIERAQVALLLSRYLKDYVYPFSIRPYLPLELRGNLNDELLPLIRPHAQTIFNELFRHNIHSYRLFSGEKIQFEPNLLQLLKLNNARGWTNYFHLEIVPSIHLGEIARPATLSRVGKPGTKWEVTNNGLHPFLIRRWIDIPWKHFATGATTVEVSFIFQKVSEAASLQSYRIVNRLSGKKRKIEIIATETRARSFAISHLSRLGASGALVNDFDLLEIPRAEVRGIVDDRRGEWSLRERLDLIATLARLRMNRYVLISPETGSVLSIFELNELREAAMMSLIDLQVVSEQPANTRSLNPVGAAFCLAPVKTVSEIGSPGDTELLFNLTGSPYLAWPRLATAADLGWETGQSPPEDVVTTLFPGIEPEAASQLQKLIKASEDCRTGRVGAVPSLPLFLSGSFGHRTFSLLRGELKQFIK